jgi:hypothetical protein
MKTPYHELSQTIKSDLHNLNNLYREREALRSERETLQDARRVISDDLLDARNDSSAIAKFAKALETKDQTLRTNSAILEALDQRIQSAETSFHSLIPKACQTFTRLLQAFKDRLHDQQVRRISNLIHPTLRETLQPLIHQLADATIESIDAPALQIPSGGVWSLTRQLTESSRSDTLQFVRQTSIALTDQADELLVELDKLGEAVQLPEFVLGPLPEPISEQLLIPGSIDFEQEWQSPLERDYILQLCKEANKDFSKLTDHEKVVLQNSLLNYRSQLQSNATRMGFTNWDGSQV